MDPRGSPFYEEADIANLHRQLAKDQLSVVFGDFNARFGPNAIIHDLKGVPITYKINLMSP